MGTNKAVLNDFNVIPDGDPYDTLIRWYFTSEEDKIIGKKQSYQLKRMLFTLKSKPAFIESDIDTPFMLISMPQYSFLT